MIEKNFEKTFECYYFVKSYNKTDGDNRHPFACVCLQGAKEKNKDWEFSRGVSICSPKDKFQKNVGRMKAKAALASGLPRKAIIRNPKLAVQITKIFWEADHLDLMIPNRNPKYGGENGKIIVNNEYKKAEFGLSHNDLTSKEREIVSGYVEG